MAETEAKPKTNWNEVDEAVLIIRRVLQSAKGVLVMTPNMANWIWAEYATPKHFLRLHGKHVRPLQPPARPVGRPKGGAKPKQSGRASVSPDVALAVYRAKDRGMKWDKIARTVLNETIPSDPRSRERLRGRVRYFYAVGLRLSRKKK